MSVEGDDLIENAARAVEIRMTIRVFRFQHKSDISVQNWHREF